ncbi:MAG: D-threitol dehydrogenase [Myxococcota bacterium]|nr:D-threitol dehydrogenase [Myxococcota bacterium]
MNAVRRERGRGPGPVIQMHPPLHILIPWNRFRPLLTGSSASRTPQDHRTVPVNGLHHSVCMSLPEFSLQGKVCVVTGALGLIGRNFCSALSQAGGTVIVTDLNGPACESFAASLGAEHGRPAMGAAVDIVSRESLAALRDAILERFQRVDVLVNNAAINDMFESPQAALELSKFENYPLELWKKSLDVNVTGMFLASQVLGAEMAKRGSGSIINIASTYGMVAPNQGIYRTPEGEQTFFKSAAYPTTKGAVLNFTRFLAAYWGGRGVRVNSLSPGGVENNQKEFFLRNYSALTPLGRMAQPNDYNGAIVFLASDASRYMTGANLVVDGGWTCW